MDDASKSKSNSTLESNYTQPGLEEHTFHWQGYQDKKSAGYKMFEPLTTLDEMYVAYFELIQLSVKCVMLLVVNQ